MNERTISPKSNLVTPKTPLWFLQSTDARRLPVGAWMMLKTASSRPSWVITSWELHQRVLLLTHLFLLTYSSISQDHFHLETERYNSWNLRWWSPDSTFYCPLGSVSIFVKVTTDLTTDVLLCFDCCGYQGPSPRISYNSNVYGWLFSDMQV